MITKDTDTETIDKLFLELSQFTKARTRDEVKYDELIFAVARKFSGETRHETALRYIREAESRATGGDAAQEEKQSR